MMSYNTIIKYLSFASLFFVFSCSSIPHPKKTESLKPKEDSIKETLFPTYEVHGMPQPQDMERQIVARWYNFHFAIGGNCITPASEDVESQNVITDKILTARIGKDWQRRFEKSADSLYSIDSFAISIAHKSEYLRLLNSINDHKNLGSNSYFFYPDTKLTCHPTYDPNIKLVSLDGYGLVYGRTGEFHYLSILVNLQKKSILHIDKTQYGW